MPFMARRPCKASSALSLVVCLVLVAFWIRSFWVTDDWFLIYRTDGSEQLSCSHGLWLFSHNRPDAGVRGGIARVSHRSARTISLLPWRLSERWHLVPYESVPPPDPRRVRQAREQIAAAQEARRRAQVAWQEYLKRGAENGFSDYSEFRGKQAEILRVQQSGDVAISFLRRVLPSYWKVIIPAWLPAAVAAIMPGLWSLGWLRRRYLRFVGHCPQCGYDLTANTSGVCPECGAPTAVLHYLTQEY